MKNLRKNDIERIVRALPAPIHDLLKAIACTSPVASSAIW